jgi:hypothetical protein
LSNTQGTFFVCRNFTEVEEYLNKIQLLQVNNVPLKNRLTYIIYYIKIQLFIFTERFHDGASYVIKEMASISRRIKDKHATKYYVVQYLSACVLFMAGNFRQAIIYLSTILNAKAEYVKGDVLVNAKILNLVVHYELNNYDHLSFILRTTKNFLTKQKRDYTVELMLIRFLKKAIAPGIPSPEQWEEFEIKLKSVLLNEKNHLSDFGFDYLSWVQRKKAGVVKALS